jgi:O-antigen/teichoic acid export membrane protein
MRHIKQLAAKMTGAGFGLLLATLASFFVTVLLSRELTPAVYGTIVVAMSTALIVSQLAQLGFMRAGIRLVAQHRLVGDLAGLKSFLLFAFFAVLVFSVPLAVIVSSHFDLFFADAFLVPEAGILAGLLIWPLAVSRLASGVLLGQHRPMFGSFFQTGIPNLGIITSVAFSILFLGESFASNVTVVIVSGGYLATIIGLVLLLPRVDDLHQVPRSPFTPCSWLAISLPIMFLGLMQIANRQASVIIIGALEGSEAVAQFFPAFRISELAIFGLAAINAAIAPRIAEYYKSGDRQGLQSILHIAALLSFGSTVVLISGILLLKGMLFSLFAGVADQGQMVLFILLIGHVMNTVTGSVSVLMTMSGQEKFSAMLAIIMTFIHILTQIPLVKNYGIEGAAVGIAGTSMIWNLILLYRAKTKVGVNPTVFNRMTFGFK